MSALSPLVSHDQDALRCPADIYRQLRDGGVRYVPEIDAYVVSRHDDVIRVLRDGKTFSSRNTVGRVVAADAPADPRALTPLLLMSDDPVHARRRSISTARSPRLRSPPGNRRSGSSPGNTSSGCAT